MTSKHHALFVGLALAAPAAVACDCYGPPTFCGVQAPPPPFWEYTPPDHIIMGVKLGESDHGMDVQVLQSFSGDVVPTDTIRVWGDCGVLCRVFVDTWSDGDTLILGIHDVDFLGNAACGTSLEQSGDYMIAICGRNWLNYTNGMVVGPITTETEESMTLAEFQAILSACLAGTTGIQEPMHAGQLLWDPSRQELSWLGAEPPVWLDVIDVTGRMIMSRSWRGVVITLPDIAGEVAIVRVFHAEGVLRERIVVH